MQDADYMRRAISLAQQGAGWTSPNPLVGAIIVKDGQIIGEGWHQRCGEPHAERNALAACTADPAGATMYVTLEPCCHTGRQPPCVEAIMDAHIAKVIVGSADSNPLVAGKGVQTLRDAGIEVVEDFLRDECDALNEIFFHYITTKRPLVTMKYAMTLDGKIACHTGLSQWVTGEIAREHVHRQRHLHRAIMVGVGTVLADDPQLTCRMVHGRDPVRVVCDSKLRTPLTAKLVTSAHETPTILATCCQDAARKAEYESAGCTVLTTPARKGRVDLPDLLTQLGQREIDSVLLEGGGTLNWAALECGAVDRVMAYLAPKLFGGADAKTPVEGTGFDAPDRAVLLKNTKITPLGSDFLIESEVDHHVHGHC